VSSAFTVSLPLDGERLDRTIALFTGLTRSEIAAIIASGAVSLDGVVVTSRHRRVATGQEIVAALESATADVERAPQPNAAVPFEVLYEDADLLVINKPPGVVVHPGAGHQDDTLVSGLLAAYPDMAGDGGAESFRPGIVHRLDKDTSGVLVVARSEAIRLALADQLASRHMARTYLALARGTVSNDEGVIEAPIGRSLRDPTKMAVRQAGRSARTRYTVRERYSSPVDLSYLQVQLDTGRTHQIRVHLQAIGHPVAGDTRYGGSLGGLGLKRPFLHAWRLAFTQPETGVEIEITAPLPADLTAVLERCS
jgi:23S rRNA pseudouridine1911/1915/1917 synthase